MQVLAALLSNRLVAKFVAAWLGNEMMVMMIVTCVDAVAFLTWFLIGVSREPNVRAPRSGPRKFIAIVIMCACATFAHAQSTDSGEARADTIQAMQQRISKLEAEVAQLKSMLQHLQSTSSTSGAVLKTDVQSVIHPVAQQQTSVSNESQKTLDFLRDTTVNVLLDGYYGYNFNNPIGRVNLLRAYDVLSNSFSLNQAAVVLERAPDLNAGRRYGGRLDLQFGQATETLQGNPANELRPNVYRNIFQAYGTYIVPVGNGLTVDFGKWASSLGIEGNYAKDDINYSRSYWFDFLPFYHTGFRTNYKLNSTVALNYWLVNGTQQFEELNGFKDQMFGLVVTPNNRVTWTINYHFGQEHPDAIQVSPCDTVPVQPGLCFQKISPAPNGKLHIFDSYVSWQTTPKLSLSLEGDYVIERLWANAAPGRSSAPSKVWGGAAYAKYQLSPRNYIGARTEYLSDSGGLFTGITAYTEALKEATATYDLRVADGFDLRWEYRRDFSNRPIFLTDRQNIFSTHQDTATMGLIWWWGRKAGTW